jgi:hypothetical protein
MSLEALEKVVKEDTIPFEVAEKYLNLFLGKSDWDNHLKRLWTISASKNSTEEQRKNFVKKAISCAIMLPLLEGTTIPSPPDKLLFWCTAWTQFNEKDWFKLFQENIEEDIRITKDRNAIIMLGVVDPIDVSPLTRQAFNWLYNRAKEVSDLNEDNTKELEAKFFNLVKAYGGAVICNMFVKHKNNISKVFNWRSGYFFEKEIHKVYKIDEIIKIKNTELQKLNQKYVKKITLNK